MTCQYCKSKEGIGNNKTWYFGGGGSAFVNHSANTGWHIQGQIHSKGGIASMWIPIDCCPKCGRKLGDGDE